MNKNAVVTWASGEEFCKSFGFRSYINSLNNIKDSDFFVLTHDIPEEIRELLNKKNIIVVDFAKDRINYILRDRHLAYYEWLNKQESNYNLFLFTDSKDVIFQTNPFELWNGNSIMLVCEGMDHKYSLWNLNDQSQTQVDVREFKYNILDRPVLNGGIIMGLGSCLKNHFILIWSNTLKSIGLCTDQAVLNFLYKWLEDNPDYSYTNPHKDNFCLTGEAVKEGWIKVEFQDGLYKNLKGEPYSIVHQWDRLKQSSFIMEKYNG